MIRIAIDGPSGAGKSTVAKAVAAKLGIVYVDTGALYRTIGYYVHERNTDPKDAEAVEKLLPEIRIELKYENGKQIVLLNGEDLGDKIRTPEMSMYASAVSTIPAVRSFLLDTQREIAKKNSVIMDGRDIGTVILPDADVKIFLTASDECRAKRRCDELIAKGIKTNYDDVLFDMKLRDRQDRTRKIAPAVAAPDAIPFDNSWMTPDECVEKLIRVIEKKLTADGKA
jgi:cytidylate kinase